MEIRANDERLNDIYKKYVMSKYQKYANDVVSGKITSCKWIKLLCQRYLDMFNDERFFFDCEKVDKMIKFFELFNFFEGPKAGKKWEFIPYQEFLLYYIFGFYWKGTDKRVIQKVVLYVGRKSNKSNWSALIGLYLMIFEGAGTQVINVANSTKQAGILFRMMKQYIKQINKKGKFKILRDRLEFKKTASFCQVLSSDGASLDGYAPYGILDECENYKNSELYDGLISGQGAMKNPLIICIGTGGFLGPGSFLYDYVESSKSVLLGLQKNDSLLPAIYTLDDEDDWKDPAVWEKAMPSLGITVNKDFIQQQVEDAIQNTTLEVSVRTKNMNQFVQTSEIWLHDDIILDSMRNFEDIEGLDEDFLESYYGLDLASVSDLTACTRCIPLDDKFYLSTRFYIPYDIIKDSPNEQLYKQWIREGYLITTPGNVTDYDYIHKDLNIDREKYSIMSVSYDKWNATQMAIDLTEDGYNLSEFPQSIGAFSPFTKAFERGIKNGSIILEYNPVLRWCFQNATLKTDHNENYKPVKAGSESNKIDGVISCIMALGAYLKNCDSSFQSLYLQFNQ